jgi:single-strand DNA-binding protein
MKSLNKMQLLGHVGKDPEVKFTPGGKAIAKFSVATNDRYKDGEEWKDRTDWHNVVAWERLAEIVRDYVTKGSQIYVEGRSQTRSYEKDGETKYFTEVIAKDLILCGGKGGEPRPKSSLDDLVKGDDDIPF